MRWNVKNDKLLPKLYFWWGSGFWRIPDTVPERNVSLLFFTIISSQEECRMDSLRRLQARVEALEEQVSEHDSLLDELLEDDLDDGGEGEKA